VLVIVISGHFEAASDLPGHNRSRGRVDLRIGEVLPAAARFGNGAASENVGRDDDGHRRGIVVAAGENHRPREFSVS